MDDLCKQKGGSCWIDAIVHMHLYSEEFKKIYLPLYTNLKCPKEGIRYYKRKLYWYIFGCFINLINKNKIDILKYNCVLEILVNNLSVKLIGKQYGSIYTGGNPLRFCLALFSNNGLKEHFAIKSITCNKKKPYDELNYLDNTIAMVYLYVTDKENRHTVLFYKFDKSWRFFSNKAGYKNINSDDIIKFIYDNKLSGLMMINKI